MRVSVGLFLVVGLLGAGCKKSDAPGDSQAIGSENGPALGEGTPQNAVTPTPGVVTPTKVIQPIRPAFAPIGAAPGAAAIVPTTPVAAQTAPPASPVVATPVAKSNVATPAATTPPAGGVAVAGRGVPPPPGGRPKPGTK
jgi:hypothetical protein